MKTSPDYAVCKSSSVSDASELLVVVSLVPVLLISTGAAAA